MSVRRPLFLRTPNRKPSSEERGEKNSSGFARARPRGFVFGEAGDGGRDGSGEAAGGRRRGDGGAGPVLARHCGRVRREDRPVRPATTSCFLGFRCGISVCLWVGVELAGGELELCRLGFGCANCVVEVGFPF